MAELFHVEQFRRILAPRSGFGDWVQRYREKRKQGAKGNVPRGTFPFAFAEKRTGKPIELFHVEQFDAKKPDKRMKSEENPVRWV